MSATAVTASGRPARRARRRPSPLVLAAAVVMGLVLCCALLGEVLAPHDPDAQQLLVGLQTPSFAHPLGTDDSGRDMLSRLIVGARAAVVGPALIALGSGLVGTLVGVSAGYLGGWRDAVIMRAVDLLYALPPLLVAIVLIGVLGGGYTVAIAILMLLSAPADTRIMRGATLEQRARPYVDAARTVGVPPRRIMFRHIWPNLLPLLAANAFLTFAYSLVALSALSFLGLGADPGAPDWGRMLSDNLPLLQDNPAAVLAPGIALVLTAMAMNLLGDWAYERLADRGRAR